MKIVKEKLKLENVNIYLNQNIECTDTMIVPKFYSKKHSSDMQAMIKCICNELTVFNSYVYIFVFLPIFKIHTIK